MAVVATWSLALDLPAGAVPQMMMRQLYYVVVASLCPCPRPCLSSPAAPSCCMLSLAPCWCQCSRWPCSPGSVATPSAHRHRKQGNGIADERHRSHTPCSFARYHDDLLSEGACVTHACWSTEHLVVCGCSAALLLLTMLIATVGFRSTQAAEDRRSRPLPPLLVIKSAGLRPKEVPEHLMQAIRDFGSVLVQPRPVFLWITVASKVAAVWSGIVLSRYSTLAALIAASVFASGPALGAWCIRNAMTFPTLQNFTRYEWHITVMCVCVCECV